MIRIIRRTVPLLLAALLAVATAPMHAQGAPPEAVARGNLPQAPLRSWASLDPAQKEVLEPLRKDWNTMSARRQAHVLKRAEHWVNLPEKRREEVRQHIARWQRMTPAERKLARENRRKFERLAPQQREQLHRTFERFQRLPPAQREKLLRVWHALPPAERLHWDERRGNRKAPAPADSGQP